MKLSPSLLRQIEAHKMTEDETFSHLKATFDTACQDFPEVMEAYANRFPGVDNRLESKEFMRAALMETINQRYPLKRRGA